MQEKSNIPGSIEHYNPSAPSLPSTMNCQALFIDMAAQTIPKQASLHLGKSIEKHRVRYPSFPRPFGKIL
jgi:hypothetical protein